jgi:hypothetical protein
VLVMRLPEEFGVNYSYIVFGTFLHGILDIRTVFVQPDPHKLSVQSSRFFSWLN